MTMTMNGVVVANAELAIVDCRQGKWMTEVVRLPFQYPLKDSAHFNIRCHANAYTNRYINTLTNTEIIVDCK